MIRRQMMRGAYYCAEARALFARMTSEPSAPRKKAINRLIVSLKTAGLWTKIDALYLLAAHNEQAALLNWKGSSYGLTKTGAPAFEADRGFTGFYNGQSLATDYLSTGFKPLTAGGQMTLNSAALSGWSRTSAGVNGQMMGGAFPQSMVAPRNPSDFSIYGINQAGNEAPTYTEGLGCWTATRTASNLVKLIRNGSVLASATTVSTGLLEEEVRILAASQGGSVTQPWPGQCAAGAISSGLTDPDALALYNALHPYMTAVGAA